MFERFKKSIQDKSLPLLEEATPTDDIPTQTNYAVSHFATIPEADQKTQERTQANLNAREVRIDAYATDKQIEHDQLAQVFTLAFANKDWYLVQKLSWRLNFLQDWLNEMRRAGYIPLDTTFKDFEELVDTEIGLLTKQPEYPNLSERDQQTYELLLTHKQSLRTAQDSTHSY